jgi:peptidoglycan/LPS O-acetylase OafA/YrhL
MKKLPVKWKFFLAACYLQLAEFVLLTALGSFAFSDSVNSARDTFYFILFLAGSALVCLNDMLNIYTVYRYFPDLLVPPAVQSLLKISGIINVILSVVVLFLFTLVLNFELSPPETGKRDNTGLVALAVLFFLWLIGAYICILQFRVVRFLYRNNTAKMNSLINSIGTG